MTGRLLGTHPNFYLLLLLGMLPDVDLMLGILDVQHRTLTHSLVFWSAAFVPFFIKFRRVAIPYFVAVTQHILLGDLVVGRTNILWPLSDVRPGLGLSLLSPVTIALEAIGLALLVLLAIRAKEPSEKCPVKQILVLIPLAAFVAIALLGRIVLPVFLESSDAMYLERSLPTLLGGFGLQISAILHMGLIGFLLVASYRISRNGKKALTKTN
jgi:membrane-bound metal-dependent hydrolase YbcI (DUF457 family)